MASLPAVVSSHGQPRSAAHPPAGAGGFRDDRIECLGLIAPSRHGGPPLGADDYFNAMCKGDMFFSQLVGPTLGRVRNPGCTGVAPHMCDQVVRPLLDQGAGGRSPGFLLLAMALGDPLTLARNP